MKRLITLLLYVVSLIIIFLNKDLIMSWLKDGQAPVILSMCFTALLAFFLSYRIVSSLAQWVICMVHWSVC